MNFDGMFIDLVFVVDGTLFWQIIDGSVKVGNFLTAIVTINGIGHLVIGMKRVIKDRSGSNPESVRLLGPYLVPCFQLVICC